MTHRLKHAEPGSARAYRSRMRPVEFVRFDVRVEETDLTVFAESDLSRETAEAAKALRRALEKYARAHEGFMSALAPVEADPGAPEVIRRMCEAAAAWEVGPMAAVAGTFAEMIGERLLEHSSEVIVENGGDIFLSSAASRRVAVFAGEDSPFGDTLEVLLRPESGIRGVCTSSGTIGHSMSFGAADAVAAFAESAAFADAAATAVCNRIHTKGDVEKVIEAERSRGALKALVIVTDDVLGAFGDIEFT